MYSSISGGYLPAKIMLPAAGEERRIVVLMPLDVFADVERQPRLDAVERRARRGLCRVAVRGKIALVLVIPDRLRHENGQARFLAEGEEDDAVCAHVRPQVGNVPR